MQPELHVPQVAAVVRKPLENVDTVGIHVAAILEGIKVGVVRSAPRQHDLIGVVGISHLGIGGQGGSVSNTHGTVAITALHAVGMHGGRLVDLRQASLSHPDGHNVLCIIIGNGELAGIFIPGGDLVSAASVLKELNDHIVLVVANAPAQCVHIGVLAQSRCLGGDGGQGADNLVVHGISHGGGSGMLKAIGDIGQAASVLAGGVFVFADGLFEGGIAGLVLGIDGHIVVPCRTVNGGHGQGHEERIAGGGHVFGDASLHDEI